MRPAVLIAFPLLFAASLALAQAPEPTPVPTPVAAPRPSTAPVAIPPAPRSSGAAWVLMDATSGRILAGENDDVPRAPASLTKVMTSYVVAAELAAGRIRKDDAVLISERAWREGGAGTAGSFSGFEVNSRAPLETVMTGMVVQSGNDASIALAEHVAGTEEAFAQLMNSYAKKLGMTQSNFVNSHGLDAEGQVMSARDMAILSRALVNQFPEAYALHSMKEFTWNGITQHNRNGLLWKDPSVDGIKTGHTSTAGYNLAASAKRGDMRLISVVMGIQTDSRAEAFRLREGDNLALLNWGFRFFETHALFDPAEALATQPLYKGEADTVALGVARPILVTLPRGRYGDLKPQIDVPKQLLAPITKGQAIGTVRVMLDGKPVAEAPLVALSAVPEAGFVGRMVDEFRLWWNAE
ncbi:MAG: D-alanyl-D-alanine carboxypeptidase family protein [Lysobacteraceae bacterium]|jgi:D-alanyl-D-alanine carboxypeptidase (penicillin-binding protein 5/6)|nr:D-alanyl-D-alanine carboxypeptidase [Silanimonas sp.]